MITLIGVGHVFDIKERVRDTILERRPTAVCLELDAQRFNAMLIKADYERRGEPLPKPPLRPGGSLLYGLLARFQQKVAEIYGVSAGGEMMAALEASKQIGAKVFLIDADSSKTVGAIWPSMTMREKIKFISGGFRAVLISKEDIDDEIDKFQENSESYIETLGKEFPTVKKLLIDDRNSHMARAIIDINKTHTGVVAVIGDGHIDGILKNLEAAGLGAEKIRLKELRAAKEELTSNRDDENKKGRGKIEDNAASVTYTVRV